MSNAGNFRIVVLSDTHGSFRAMNSVFRKNSKADLFIFLGDGEDELERVRKLYRDRRILSVRGNCDDYSNADKEQVFTAPDGRKIFFTHGNEYSVNSSLDRLYYRGLELEASVVLFGHTHQRYYQYIDGLYLLNPGSAACPRDGLSPSYAFIDLLENGIFCAHVEL